MENFSKQQRNEMALNFFNLLFENVHEQKFGYLWTKQNKKTYPFTVSNAEERVAMATKAIEINDEGFDVYYGVNLMDTPPAEKERVKAEKVTVHTATVTDIDCEGGNHISTDKKKYPPTFDDAKALLPFELSITVNSGYGFQGYCLYQEPVAITDDEERKAAETRNKKFINVIRKRAGEFNGAVDGVGDLPRVLRVPGTFNYKLGRENAPICHLVDVSDVRFTPAELDEKLTALTQTKEKSKQAKTEKKSSTVYQSADDRDRALNMLAVIPVADLSYDDWLHIGMALKNNGNNVADWEEWSRNDERFKEEECESKWQGFSYNGGLTIGTIHDIAKSYGYQEPKHEQAKTDRQFFCADNQENRIRTTDKVKSCPISLALPESFAFGYGGIDFVVPPKKENGNPKYICVTRTPLIPVKKFHDPEKGNVEYEIGMLVDGEWISTEISGTALADNKELAKTLSGKGALIVEPKYLCRFFADIISINPELPKIKSYSQTGWTDDNYEDFAFPSENGKCVVRRQGFNFDRVFKPKGNPAAWKDNFREIMRQGGAQARCIMGAAAASFLIRPLGLPNLQVHLWGVRSLGKTPLERFVVSAFGDTRVGALTYTFSASPKSRLETAAAFRDCPIIGEELESIGKREAEQLQQDIYNFSLGISGQALQKNGTLRDPKLFNNTRLTSGEHEITKQNGNGGELKRVLQLRVSALLDEDFAASLHGFCDHNHGLCLKQWTEYIIKNYDAINKEYHLGLKIGKQQHPDIDSTQLATLISSLVAYQHFKLCIGLQDSINCAELGADRIAIVKTLPSSKELDDTERAMEFLRSYVASHDKSFAHEVKDKPEFDNEFTQTALICQGKMFRDGEVAFTVTEFKKILEEEGGFTSADKLRAEFYDKDYLRHTNGKMTFPTYFNGRMHKMIRFKAGTISTPELKEDEENHTPA